MCYPLTLMPAFTFDQNRKSAATSQPPLTLGQTGKAENRSFFMLLFSTDPDHMKVGLFERDPSLACDSRLIIFPRKCGIAYNA